MKEYILFIHSDANIIDDLLQDEGYMKKLHLYINNLASKGHLVDVKPLLMEGMIFTATAEKNINVITHKNMDGLAGYLHVSVANQDELTTLVKEHPFLEKAHGSIEVRPVRLNP